MRGFPRFFRSLEEKLGAFESIDAIRSNPSIGSVLILHHGKPSEIKRFGRRERLFLMVRSEGARRRDGDLELESSSDEIADRVERINRAMIRKTAGKVDLTLVSAATLMGLSVIQLING